MLLSVQTLGLSVRTQWLSVPFPSSPEAFNDPEPLGSLHISAAHVQDHVHGVPLFPEQGLGAQSGPEVRHRFA